MFVDTGTPDVSFNFSEYKIKFPNRVLLKMKRKFVTVVKTYEVTNGVNKVYQLPFPFSNARRMMFY